MMRLRSDLLTLCQQALAGSLADVALQWDSRTSLGVVLAAGGYPLEYHQGDVISGLDGESVDTRVFHAGTRLDDRGQVVTSGGRVLCVVGLGESVRQAAAKAYERLNGITWENVYYRRDIGHRAISREDGAHS